jgi:methylmalonyl-CoA/ethylmalonyl-CoA epimerase
MIFHHIGIACKEIPKELERLKKIHTVIDQSAIIYDHLQEVNLCMVTIEGGFKMELVSGKTVEALVKKGSINYHLCFECDNINSEIERLVSNGALLVSPTKPAILFGGKLVAFMLVSYGLIELVQK